MPGTRRRAPRKRKAQSGIATLKKDVKILKSLTKPEFKWQDTYNTWNATTAVRFDLLNGLQQGLDAVNRIGREVNWKSFFCRYVVEANTTATNSRQVRLVLVWVKQPNGIALTALQLFGTATPLMNNMFNLNSRGDFKILHDMNIVVSPPAGSPSAIYKKHYQKCQFNTIFNAGNAGTVADIDKGAYYLVSYSSTAVAGELPVISFQQRSRYLDS